MVGPMIDPAQANIRFPVQYFVHGQLHTVYRGAGALKGFNSIKYGYRMQAQGQSDRNGMTHAGLGLIRGHNYHFTQIFDGFHKISNSRSHNAIVVGDQDNGAGFFI
jgi:hypothetical protein